MPDHAKAFQGSIWRRWEANKREAQRISTGGDRLKKANQMVKLLQERQQIASRILHKMQYVFGLEGWGESGDLRDLVRLQDRVRNSLAWLVDRPLQDTLYKLKNPDKYPVESAEIAFDEIAIPWWYDKAYAPGLLKGIEANMAAMFDLLEQLPKGEGGEEIFRAGGFTVVNKLLIQPGATGNSLDYAQSASISKHVARTLNVVASRIKAVGMGGLLYGLLDVLPMTQGKLNGRFVAGLEAVYKTRTDRIALYLLPIAYEGRDAQKALIHELGHRYYYKRMKMPQRLLWEEWSSRYKTPPVSRRGADSPAEKFAEAFTWYVLGRQMGADQREEFEAIMKKSNRQASDLLATDPETGATRTLDGWAKHFADRLKDAAHDVRVARIAVGESLDHSWSGHSTFAPMRHGEEEIEIGDEIEAQPSGPGSKYFFDNPVKRVVRDLQEKGRVPTPTQIVEDNPLGKEYSTLSRFVVGGSRKLRSAVIRLAHANPDLRADLLPLLKGQGGR